MSVFLRQAATIAGLLLVGACAAIPPKSGETEALALAAYQAEEPVVLTADDFVGRDFTARSTGLKGRTIRVNSISDIRLRPKEVVLTFDDGPVPGKTDRILAALDKHGVKATFLMVGQMAKANPSLARAVVRRGHSVGSHTYGHPNLANMNFDAAVAEIRKGEKAIRDAGIREIAFFRFPYLGDTGRLRNHLASRGITVLDVDVDSKDYFKVSPSHIVTRTMNQLQRKGRGIILMHDLHGRTASMLPTLLTRLKAEGYSVVHLAPATGSGALVASAN